MPSEVVGSFFGDIAHGVSNAAKAVGGAAKAVVRSPVTKVTAAGLAFVVPAVGVPATAALVAADKVIAAGEKGGEQGKAAKRALAITHQAAKSGDADAQRGLAVLVIAKRAREAVKKAPPNAKRAAAVAASHAATEAAKKAASIPVTGHALESGILVHADGRVSRGHFSSTGNERGTLVTDSGKVLRGNWKQA